MELSKKLANRKLIKIQDLRIGERFYNWEGVILELLDCDYDPADPTKIKYVARRLGTRNIQTYTTHGNNAGENYFYRYTQRDYSSFNAGFRSAMKLMTTHMTPTQIQMSGLDFMPSQHLTMTQEYQNWKRNLDNLW